MQFGGLRSTGILAPAPAPAPAIDVAIAPAIAAQQPGSRCSGGALARCASAALAVALRLALLLLLRENGRVRRLDSIVAQIYPGQRLLLEVRLRL